MYGCFPKLHVNAGFLTIGSQLRESRTGPMGSGLRVGADRESGNTPGFVRAKRLFYSGRRCLQLTTAL